MIIWGNKKQREGVGYTVHSCYRCGMTVHVVAEQKSKFTVYFIPVFTYSHKAFLFCSSCNAETELGGEAAKEALKKKEKKDRKQEKLDRVDPQVSFDFGAESPVPGKMLASEFTATMTLVVRLLTQWQLLQRVQLTFKVR